MKNTHSTNIKQTRKQRRQDNMEDSGNEKCMVLPCDLVTIAPGIKHTGICGFECFAKFCGLPSWQDAASLFTEMDGNAFLSADGQTDISNLKEALKSPEAANGALPRNAWLSMEMCKFAKIYSPSMLIQNY